jgi:hypothetical protein
MFPHGRPRPGFLPHFVFDHGSGAGRTEMRPQSIRGVARLEIRRVTFTAEDQVYSRLALEQSSNSAAHDVLLLLSERGECKAQYAKKSDCRLTKIAQVGKSGVVPLNVIMM